MVGLKHAPAHSLPWLLDRLSWHFDPCTHRRSRHFYHVLSTRDLSIYLSFMSHGTNQGTEHKETSAKHLLILTFLVHDYL